MEFEEGGLPTVNLVTHFFEQLALVVAKGRGLAQLKIVSLPYPYETLPPDRIRDIARAAMPKVVHALTDVVTPALVKINSR